MKVLIICNNFPPLNTVGGHRPYSWYKYFKKYGIEPIVVTKNQTINNQASFETQKETTDFGEIVRVPTRNILPERMLLKYGKDKYAGLRKIFTYIYRILSFTNHFFDRHFLLYEAAEKIVKSEKIDFVIITGEPFILFRYGYLLHKKYGVKWVADYRDGWSLNPIFKQRTDLLNRILQSWERRQELKIVHTSHFITYVDPFGAIPLSQLHGKKAEVLYNGFEDFYQGSRTSTDSRLVLTHSGTLTSLQEIEFLLQAVKELHEENKISEKDLVLQFIGLELFPGQVERVENFSPLIKKYLFISPRVPKEENLQINAASDFLLSVTENNFPAYYTKTYDYIAVRKPILVLPAEKALSALIKDLNAGYSFDTIPELKLFLLEKVNQKKNNLPLTDLILNEEKASFFKREKQAAIFVDLLKQYA